MREFENPANTKKSFEMRLKGDSSDEGEVFMLLKIGDDATNVANPAVAVFQAHQVTVDGDLFRRDGVNYLLVTRIATDEGVVNITHDEMGIQPFGK